MWYIKRVWAGAQDSGLNAGALYLTWAGFWQLQPRGCGGEEEFEALGEQSGLQVQAVGSCRDAFGHILLTPHIPVGGITSPSPCRSNLSRTEG